MSGSGVVEISPRGVHVRGVSVKLSWCRSSLSTGGSCDGSCSNLAESWSTFSVKDCSCLRIDSWKNSKACL